MTTSTSRPRAFTAPFLALVLGASVGLAACASGANPADPIPAAPATPGAVDPVGPGNASGGGVDPGVGGGGSAGNPGSGIAIDLPLHPKPIDPGAGQALLVRPVPGRLAPHPVVPVALQASVDGRHVLVKVSWYGGVEPCSVLDSVKVEASGMDISVTPIEGSSAGDVACIDIAQLKATIVDLGELSPGTWRISGPGSDVAPIVITID